MSLSNLEVPMSHVTIVFTLPIVPLRGSLMGGPHVVCQFCYGNVPFPQCRI